MVQPQLVKIGGPWTWSTEGVHGLHVLYFPTFSNMYHYIVMHCLKEFGENSEEA